LKKKNKEIGNRQQRHILNILVQAAHKVRGLVLLGFGERQIVWVTTIAQLHVISESYWQERVQAVFPIVFNRFKEFVVKNVQMILDIDFLSGKTKSVGLVANCL